MMCGPREIKRGNWVPDQIRSGGENNHSARGGLVQDAAARRRCLPVLQATVPRPRSTAADWKGDDGASNRGIGQLSASQLSCEGGKDEGGSEGSSARKFRLTQSADKDESGDN